MSQDEIETGVKTCNLIGDPFDWYPEARLKLFARADAVDLDRIGCMDIEFDNFFERSKLEKLMRIAVAQAWLDNINQREEGLVIRPIMPDIDFRTQYDNEEIRVKTLNHWWQPSSNIRTMDVYRRPFEDSEVPIYWTNINSNNARKVMLVYGFQDVGYKNHHVRTIKIVRPGVKTLANYYLTPGNAFYELQYPILSKRGDDFEMRFIFRDGRYFGSHTNIKLYGMIVESFGSEVI